MMRFLKTALWTSAALIGLALIVAAPATADQVILDDLIVDGSACIGFDCVNGESFGFDTIRIKENNLRIRAQDTSSTASFPSNDWQITFNDSANGGAEKFSIDDIDGGRTPFTLEAGAPSHSLYVDDGGRLGLGTSTPVTDIHIKSGNTPTLRLEQDGSSGFTPQTWDVAGNEANFFIRDATNGSTLPFRIRPGAPSSSIDIQANGDVEFVPGGLDSDSTKGGTGAFTIEHDSGFGFALAADATDLDSGFALKMSFNAIEATTGGASRAMQLNPNGAGVGIGRNPATNSFEVEGDASKTVAGDWLANSDRRIKTEISDLDDALGVIRRVRPISFRYTDEYRAEHPSIRDIEYYNVTAQEFAEVFPESVRVGGDRLPSGEAILQVDTYPAQIYSIAAIQELDSLVQGLVRQNAELLESLEGLESQLAAAKPAAE